MIDTVAKPFALVKTQLDKAKINYKVTISHPTRQATNLDENCPYVIRQRFDGDMYHLVTANKAVKGKA
ncbi:hypothetical protein [Pelosinus sp. IPA-1]|uniref:hypothetical protein n=1 Tax=Pelosinus sp. IPA-1 TaxID=3029569 RepID=UPI002436272A|nr:hypothetical protein [Pelosinus sp. IPA-1]GMA99727.1 hypothetical protein PIPA1_25270 [Pelosinus sp. IPA-1]